MPKTPATRLNMSDTEFKVPTSKSPAIERVLEAVSQTLANTRSQAFEHKTCVLCGKEAGTFTDARSQSEYLISGMCQTCQDRIFDK
tara:strand:+ start:374 stop:631 length:258 start_codon:yes stop_codon:yes gene_type:complete